MTAGNAPNQSFLGPNQNRSSDVVQFVEANLEKLDNPLKPIPVARWTIENQKQFLVGWLYIPGGKYRVEKLYYCFSIDSERRERLSQAFERLSNDKPVLSVLLASSLDWPLLSILFDDTESENDLPQPDLAERGEAGLFQMVDNLNYPVPDLKLDQDNGNSDDGHSDDLILRTVDLIQKRISGSRKTDDPANTSESVERKALVRPFLFLYYP